MLDVYFFHDRELQKQLQRMEAKIMANFDSVNAAHSALKTEVSRAVVLLHDLAETVKEGGADQATLDAFAADLSATADSLKAANDAV